MSDVLAALAIIIVLLFYIALKLERIEKQANRVSASDVDEEMKELNPRGISK